VSFNGGDAELHGRIAKVAGRWSEHCGLDFDFGHDEATGAYRQWSVGDRSHIRVGFSQNGYWSLVGTDSTDWDLIEPGEISLNLSGFDGNLPGDWEGTVLHEFGHAMGFHHEHQSPVADCDFDWDKLYDYLAGPPNYWPKWKVDHNLKQMPARGLTYSAHDADSIMHYSFPAWMFVQGANSPCHTPRHSALSAADKTMAERAYPEDSEDAGKLVKTRVANLAALTEIQNLPAATRKQVERHLAFLS
jgi:hypothetical protein